MAPIKQRGASVKEREDEIDNTASAEEKESFILCCRKELLGHIRKEKRSRFQLQDRREDAEKKKLGKMPT